MSVIYPCFADLINKMPWRVERDASYDPAPPMALIETDRVDFNGLPEYTIFTTAQPSLQAKVFAMHTIASMVTMMHKRVWFTLNDYDTLSVTSYCDLYIQEVLPLVKSGDQIVVNYLLDYFLPFRRSMVEVTWKLLNRNLDLRKGYFSSNSTFDALLDKAKSFGIIEEMQNSVNLTQAQIDSIFVPSDDVEKLVRQYKMGAPAAHNVLSSQTESVPKYGLGLAFGRG